MAQVLTRAEEYLDGYDTARGIVAALAERGEIALPVLTSGEEYVVESMMTDTGVQYIGPDANRLHEFSTNLTCYVKKI